VKVIKAAKAEMINVIIRFLVAALASDPAFSD